MERTSEAGRPVSGHGNDSGKTGHIDLGGYSGSSGVVRTDWFELQNPKHLLMDWVWGWDKGMTSGEL